MTGEPCLDCGRRYRGTECPCQRLDQPTCAEEELDDAMGVPRGTFAGDVVRAIEAGPPSLEVRIYGPAESREDEPRDPNVVERHRDPAFVSEAEARERSR